MNVRHWLSGPIARTTLNTTGILFIRLLVQAGSLVAMARLLEIDTFGLFSVIATSAVLMGSLATMGTHLFVLDKASRHIEDATFALSRAIPVTLVASLVLMGIFLAISLTLTSSHIIAHEAIILLAMAEFLPQPLVMVACLTLQAQGRITLSQLLMLGPLCVRLVVISTAFLYPNHDAVMSWSVGYLSGSMLALLVAIMLLRPWLPSPASWRFPGRDDLRTLSRYSLLNITALGSSEADKPLVGWIGTLSMAGIYTASTRIISVLVIPVMAMMLSSLPRLFRENQAENTASEQLQRIIFVMALAHGCTTGLLVFWMAPFAPLIFGQQFMPMVVMLEYLAFAVPAIALRVSSAGILVGQRRPERRAIIEVAGILLWIGSAVVFLPVFSERGFAIAVIVSEWLMAITGWYCVRQRFITASSK